MNNVVPTVFDIPRTKQPKPGELARLNARDSFSKRRISRLWNFSGNPYLTEVIYNEVSVEAVGEDPNVSWQPVADGLAVYSDENNFNNSVLLTTSAGPQIYNQMYRGGFTIRFRLDNLTSVSGLVRFCGSIDLEVATDGTLTAQRGVDSISTAAGAIVADEWYTVTVIWHAVSGTDEIRMWLDGERVDTYIGGEFYLSGSTYILRDSTGNGMVGAISFFCEHYGAFRIGTRVYPDDYEIEKFHKNPFIAFAPKKMFTLNKTDNRRAVFING